MDWLGHGRYVDAFEEGDEGEEWEEETVYYTADVAATAPSDDVLKSARDYDLTGWPETPLIRLGDQVYLLEPHQLIGSELIFQAVRDDREDRTDVACIGTTSHHLVLRPVQLYPKAAEGGPQTQNGEPFNSRAVQVAQVPAPHPAFADDLEGWHKVQESIDRSHRAIEQLRAKQKKRMTIAATLARDEPPVAAQPRDSRALLSALTERPEQ